MISDLFHPSDVDGRYSDMNVLDGRRRTLPRGSLHILWVELQRRDIRTSMWNTTRCCYDRRRLNVPVLAAPSTQCHLGDFV